MPTTPNFGLPYPEGTDPFDVPADMQALADALDGQMISLDQGPFASRPISTPVDPGIAGRIYFASDNGTLYMDNGISWTKIVISPADTIDLADGAVTTAKLGDNAVTVAKIADGNVVAAKIGDTAVTTAKILDLNVTTGKIANNAVTTAKLANPATTNLTIANAWQPGIGNAPRQQIEPGGRVFLTGTCNNGNNENIGFVPTPPAQTSYFITAGVVSNLGSVIIRINSGTGLITVNPGGFVPSVVYFDGITYRP